MDTKPSVISKDFVTEVAKYFMAFLETDFKKRTQPKRNLTTRVNKGLTVGLFLDKYPALYRELYKNFVAGFPKDSIDVRLGQYTTKISERLVSLLDQRIDQLDDADVEKALSGITKEINQLRLDNQKDYDNFFESSVDVIKLKIDSAIVVQLLNDIEKSLEAAGWSPESGLFQLETDATAKVYTLVEDTIGQLLEEFFATDQTPNALQDSLSQLLEPEAIKASLKEFFKEFSAADAYAEIQQLNRNREMLDKTELYVYFGEVGVNNYSFPLFYMPISVDASDSSLSIHFENRVFVNIKAIEFVVQQNNTATENNESVAGSFERIIYFEDKKELLPALQKIVDEVREVLGLTKAVDIKEASSQISNNMVTRVSNRLQLFLFDKSDESLINDYEEIIEDQGELTEAFAELIDSFVTENPTSYIEEVAQEWDEKSIPDKLLVDSPIALNEEQKQVLLALQKKDCRIAILEGPPGTGKSHTITAIVCKALLEGQSVLVLSDKEEALDVVQDKITDTLSTIRHDKNFQNPILRLGKSSGGLSKVIDGQVLDRVREHMRAYRSRQSDFESAEEEAKSEADSTLGTTIQVGEQVDLKEVAKLLEVLEKFKDMDWIESIDDELAESFADLHVLLGKIKNSRALYLLPYANSAVLSNLPKITSSLSTYSQSRSSLSADTAPFINGYKSLSPDAQKTLQKQLVLTNENAKSALDFYAETKYFGVKGINTHTTFKHSVELRTQFSQSQEISNAVKMFAPNRNNISGLIDESLKSDVTIEELHAALSSFVQQLQALKSRLGGFFGKKSAIDGLLRNLKAQLPYFNLSAPERRLQELVLYVDMLNFCIGKMNQMGLASSNWKSVLQLIEMGDDYKSGISKAFDVICAPADTEFVGGYSLGDSPKLTESILAYQAARSLQETVHANEQILTLLSTETSALLSHPVESIEKLKLLSSDAEELTLLLANREKVEEFISNYPDVATSLNLQPGTESFSAVDSRFTALAPGELEEYIGAKKDEKLMTDKFNVLATDSFSDTSEALHLLNAAKMANILDTRIISYVDNHAADIRTMKSMLKSKQKFPKVLFGDLKQAFPCILAGIRDYATYIPLEKNIFDLVIIDEASQVSIAQALPALIRGKKILVLGDDKQFSNVKAGNASALTNSKFRSNLLSSLRDSIDNQAKDYTEVYSARVNDNFNVKKSILDFCRFITNYQTMLKKHFRCYPEVIAYSNYHFYGGNLQAMKARALPINEVLKFSFVEAEDVKPKFLNTNPSEAQFILEQFEALKNKDYPGTLGVITPHPNQAAFINTVLNESAISGWLHEHRLKIMTFDTCQGEERDYIFYSMVATTNIDKHFGIFPISMAESIKTGKEFGTREQRLNVGFSRAKETVHFVLSKPIEEYWGEVRNALVFYDKILKETTHVIGGTDEKSAMEPLVQNYFYQTKFFEKNKEQVELVPQFPLGEYLARLDRNYTHPKYKVDFLLTFGKQKIVIEYDGFKEHFIDLDDVDASNYESYLKADDVYRQKVLEGYGYKFLRLNKFNLGKDPINQLDGMLADIVKKKTIRQGQLIPSYK